MADNLDSLLEDGVIDEIVGRLKSGKEAEVFLVRYRGQVVAAKVYKDRQTRSFKNNAAYTEGRGVRNSRTRRAMEKGSRFGQDSAEDAWKSSEADALYKLHAHGVRVPTPLLFYGGVLLMQVVVDAEGETAPRLIDAPLDADSARTIYRDLRAQMIGMLCCEIIHGDLSPYNVLIGVDGPTLIDFPQVISPAHNNQADVFFRRDFENILNFLGAADRSLLERASDGREIWKAYVRRELTPEFVPPERPRFEPRPPPGRDRFPRPAGPRAHGPDPRRPEPPPDGGSPGVPSPAPMAARPADPREAHRPLGQRGPRHEDLRPRTGPPRHDQAPFGGQRRDQAPNTDQRRDQAPFGGQRRDQAPNTDQRRDQAPNMDQRRDQAPNAGPRRDQAPFGGQRRDQAPNMDPRRDQAPNMDPRRDQAPSAGPQRAQEPLGSPGPESSRSRPPVRDQTRTGRRSAEAPVEVYVRRSAAPPPPPQGERGPRSSAAPLSGSGDPRRPEGAPPRRRRR